MAIQSFVQTSVLHAPAQAVWERAITPEGINGELMPIMKMTVPKGADGLDIGNVRPPQRLGKSWLLLGGLIPIDYDDITIAELGPDFRFQEVSTMASMRVWTHERVVREHPDGCTVTDSITFELRIPPLSPLMRPALRAMFKHRHRKLRSHFGA